MPPSPRAPRSRIARLALVVLPVATLHLAVLPPAAGAQDTGGPEAGPEATAATPADLLALLTWHEQLVQRLGDLQAELQPQAAAAAPEVALDGSPLPPRVRIVDRSIVALEQPRTSELDLAATYEALLATRQALVDVNPGTALGIGPAVFPVAGPYEFVDSWGQARSGGRRHKGTDILAPEGAPLLAIESGRIERYSNNALGGLSFYFRGDSGARYYYAHLSAFGPFAEGDWVEVGTVIGYNGDTGNARGTPHLHFQYAPDGDEGWVNPYGLLTALRDAVWPGAPLPAALLAELPPLPAPS